MADLYGLLIEDLFRGRPPRIPRPFNPDHFLWRAGEHGLHGLLHAAVARRADLPPALRDLESRLLALTMAQEAVVRVRLSAAGEVAAALAREGVPAVFVKGVALALVAYDRLGHRSFADLDVLVPADEVHRTRGTLRSIGFQPDLSVSRSSIEERHSRGGGAGRGIGVDLHWDFAQVDGAQAAVRIPFADILARRREVGAIPVPTVEDSLLLGAANLVRSRMDRLILLADFGRLAGRGPRWEEVVGRARQWRLGTALWLGLEYSRRLMGADVPGEVLSALRPAAWRSASIGRVLDGSFLWLRRKFKRRLAVGVLPYLCLDSWGDMVRGIGARRRSAMGGLRAASR